MTMLLSERREMLLTLFDPEDFTRPAVRRSVMELDLGRRARRDQRALRKGLRLCGVCQGQGMSKRAARRATGRSLHGHDRTPLFYVYAHLTRAEYRDLQQQGVQRRRVGAWRRADGGEIAKPLTDPRYGINMVDPKRINADERDDDRAYFEVPWFEVRIACWACLGSGFNCSSEMARALEARCHTQRRSSPSPKEGARL